MSRYCVSTVLQNASSVSTAEGLRDHHPSRITDIRLIHTSTICRDIDQAAKYIGAGAATVGVAGSGDIFVLFWLEFWSVD